MADSTMSDTTVLYLGPLVLALIALTAGLVIHSFIIGVNVSDWWRGRSVTPVDHIVTSLGISRMCAQCTLIPLMIVLTFYLRSPDSQLYMIVFNRTYVFFLFSNIGLTSLFSIVLCLKISNLQTRLFLYLRRMILHRTGRLIAALLVFSGLNRLITFLLIFAELSKSGSYNTTVAYSYPNDYFLNGAINFITGTFFPLLFYCISSVLLFVSLYHHTTRMKMSSNLSINLETYYSVMKLVSVTFIYNTVYFTGHVVSIFYHYIYRVYPMWLYIINGSLPVLHSSYMIYRAAKLRNQMSKVLQNVMDFLFQRKATATGENIKVVDQ